jgi:hypothetical protein
MKLKFWKKEKSQEDILKEMRDAEKIELLKLIQKNREEGKPESENLIPLREMNYHTANETEEEKKKTEIANRRSKVEKVAGTISPFVVMGCAFWNAAKDSKGENVNRTDGGKRISRMLDTVTTKFTEFKNSFKK